MHRSCHSGFSCGLEAICQAFRAENPASSVLLIWALMPALTCQMLKVVSVSLVCRTYCKAWSMNFSASG